MTKAVENIIFFVQAVPGKENGDVFADDFFGRVTEETFGAGIPGLNNAVEIFREHHVARGLDDCGEAGASLLRFALLRDVAEDEDDASDGAAGFLDWGSTVIDRNFATVPGQEHGVIGEA